MSLCQNRSTCLNTYYELGYFKLITGETCHHESEKLINCVKANHPIFAQTCLYKTLTCKKCIIFMWFAPIMSIIEKPSYNMTILSKNRHIKVIYPTYCEIIGALITYVQKTCINHK